MHVAVNVCLKSYRFKQIGNDDDDIGRRKQQKLVYRMFTCKFPVSYITMSAGHDIQYNFGYNTC